MKSKLIPDSWNINSGWGARLCSCKTKITDYMKLHGFCNIKEVPLTDGCQMVQMTISDAQDFSIDKFRYGLTTYAHVKLDRTLRVGKKYRVSIQSYFPERSNYKSTIHSRTGIKLFNKEINTNNVGVIYTDNFLALDQLTTNKWNKSEWIIAPLCELNYLTVGFFSNDDVSNEIFHHFSNNWVRYYYFIDDIRVEEYEGDEEFVHYDCYDESQVNIRSGLKDSLVLLFD
ncbi:MAG: hypothetical protein HKN67_07460, partial [Saprospiraceae bacterium]|nr:hypothetical protein [Saprospiraceae bacterium]